MRYTKAMSKILKCPVCGEEKPVRNDAKVCSGTCRVKQWRKDKMATNNKQVFLNEHGSSRSDKWSVEFKNGTCRTYKHVYGGAEELAEQVNWDAVAIVDGELQVSEA